MCVASVWERRAGFFKSLLLNGAERCSVWFERIIPVCVFLFVCFQFMPIIDAAPLLHHSQFVCTQSPRVEMKSVLFFYLCSHLFSAVHKQLQACIQWYLFYINLESSHHICSELATLKLHAAFSSLLSDIHQPCPANQFRQAVIRPQEMEDSL